MKKKSIVLTALITVLVAGMLFNATRIRESDLPHLDPKTAQQVISIDEMLKYWKDPDGAFYFLSGYQGQVPQEYVQRWINEGYFGDYIEQIQALGYSVTAASAPSAPSTTESTPAPTPEPEAFTVEPYNPPKTMWATSEVNCREGASTSYAKVDSLKQYDEVTVTGVASTGWYEIDRNGTKIYVSNKYLTDVDPHNRTVYDYDAENHEMNAYEFTDTDPKVIDQFEESLEPEETTVEESTTEVAEETTVEETIEEPTEESTEEVEYVTLSRWETLKYHAVHEPYMLVAIGIFFIFFVISAVMTYRTFRKKKRDRD